MAVFLFCVLATELALRIAGYGNVEIYEPDALLYWRLKPGQDRYTKIDHKPVHINSLGTRGVEFNPQKPANTLRILSLGDSKTFGWGLSDTQTYSALLARHLQDWVGPARSIEVINAGVNAWSYQQMKVFLRERGVLWHPDIVILGDANLWTQFSEGAEPAFVKSFLRRVWLKNFLRRFAIYHYVVEVKLVDFYQRTRTKFIPVDPKQDQLFKAQQKSDPDAIFRSTITDICRISQTNRIKTVLLFVPSQDALLSTNNIFANILHAKLEAAQKFQAPLVDVTTVLQPEAKQLYLEGDTIHLNAAGNKIVARELFETLKKMISR